ncbi:MAG: hypothetical protein HYZ28_26365 [Myxococcales bacterium]|nr:hypothetical protein [Myxococcales bacterium]
MGKLAPSTLALMLATAATQPAVAAGWAEEEDRPATAWADAPRLRLARLAPDGVPESIRRGRPPLNRRAAAEPDLGVRPEEQSFLGLRWLKGPGPAAPRHAEPRDMVGAVLAIPDVEAAVSGLTKRLLFQARRDSRAFLRSIHAHGFANLLAEDAPRPRMPLFRLLDLQPHGTRQPRRGAPWLDRPAAPQPPGR